MAVHSFVTACQPCLRFRRACRGALASGAAIALLLTVATAAPLAGQYSVPEGFAVATEAGLIVPAGSLEKYVGVGTGATLRVAYQWNPALAFAVKGGFDRMPGARLPHRTNQYVPDIQGRRITGGLEYVVRPPEFGPWSVLIEAGAGMTRLESESFQHPREATTVRYEQTGLTGNAGLEIGYALSRVLELFAGGDVYVTRLDSEASLVLESLAPFHLDPFATARVMAFQIGLRARL